MRIIRGRFGRRKLLSNPGDTTRPITDKVKESLFEYLEDELQGARVADIFAGTGTIGLESLSRGATSIVFFERDRKAVELLRKNVATLKIEDETLCWATDVMKTSFRPKNCEGMTPFDIAFFDPPSRHRETTSVKIAREAHLVLRGGFHLFGSVSIRDGLFVMCVGHHWHPALAYDI